MNRTRQKLIAMLLSLVLLLSLFPTAVFALGDGQADEPRETTADEMPPLTGVYVDHPGEKSITEAYLRGDTETVDALAPHTGTTIPSRYDSRDYGLITPIRDQNPFGTCWSFAAICSMEASMIRNQVINNDTGAAAGNFMDLSEYQHAWFTYSNGYDKNGMILGDYCEPYGDFRNLGGNGYMSTYTAMRGMGPASENADALKYSKISTSGLNPKYSFNYNVADVTDVEWIPLSNRNAVKQAIMQYGAGTINYYADDSYMNYSTNSYCFKQYATYGSNDFKYLNHLVTVVGWDDNYSKYNFNSAYGPSSNGAWIVKNSWGSYWGEDGYFYLSYEDSASLNEDSFFYKLDKANKYANCYQYDGTSNCLNSMNLGNNAQAANVFTAEGPETLKAVAIATQDEAVSYTLRIYKNPSATNPSSGTLMTTQTGKIQYAGYHTIPLTKAVSLAKNDRFSVVFTLSNPAAASGNGYVYLPIDMSKSWDLCYWHHENYGNTSFYKDPGGSWTDVPSNGDFRIKAYTDDAGSSHYLSVAGLINGEYASSVSGYCTADIYINGLLAANDVTSYYKPLAKGTRYAITDIKPASGMVFNGPVSGPLYGTVGDRDVEVKLSLSTKSTKNLTLSTKYLDLAYGKTAAVNCTVSGSLPNRYHLTYIISEGQKASTTSCAWKTWNNSTIPLEVTGTAVGNSSVHIALVDSDTGKVVEEAFLTVYVRKAPSISTQPKSVAVKNGGTATFALGAAGDGRTYQWYYKKVGESSWTKWSGKTSASVSCTAGASNSGCQYRCVVRSPFGSVTSNTVKLTTVFNAPKITTQPKSVSVGKGGTATFTVAASGEGLSYQWQYKKAGESSWSNWSGKTFATVHCVAGDPNNGCQYRCVIKNVLGTTTSKVAKLTTVNGVYVSAQPKSVTVKTGNTATFSVTASGADLTYQWYYKKVGDSSWTKWSGKTAASVSCTAGVSNDGCQYRCVVNGTYGTVTTSTAKLTTVFNAPKITSQPKSISVGKGGDATFKVSATGGGLSYQWQYKKVGDSSWSNWSGKTYATVTCKAGDPNNGCLYRCVIKNLLGTVTTNSVKLTTVNGPYISTQPKSVSVKNGATATFKVVASGENLTYQWQYKKVGESKWTNWSGKTSATVTCTAGVSNNGCLYRCIVKSTYGTATSGTATLTTVFN